MTQAAVFIIAVVNAAQGHASAEAANVAYGLNREPAAKPTPLRDPFPIQFVQGVNSRPVRILLDGRRLSNSSAGKMGFRDGQTTGLSVCANVRAPMGKGLIFNVRPFLSRAYGGNVAKAGNIVARFFREAQTPDQCAGLQLAVWEAIDDGGLRADFRFGRFAAEGSAAVMAFAEKYYQAIDIPGDALYLEIPPGGRGGSSKGQPQLTTTTT